MAPLAITRHELHEELIFFAEGALRQQLVRACSQVSKDVRNEVHALFRGGGREDLFFGGHIASDNLSNDLSCTLNGSLNGSLTSKRRPHRVLSAPGDILSPSHPQDASDIRRLIAFGREVSSGDDDDDDESVGPPEDDLEDTSVDFSLPVAPLHRIQSHKTKPKCFGRSSSNDESMLEDIDDAEDEVADFASSDVDRSLHNGRVVAETPDFSLPGETFCELVAPPPLHKHLDARNSAIDTPLFVQATCSDDSDFVAETQTRAAPRAGGGLSTADSSLCLNRPRPKPLNLVENPYEPEIAPISPMGLMPLCVAEAFIEEASGGRRMSDRFTLAGTPMAGRRSRELMTRDGDDLHMFRKTMYEGSTRRYAASMVHSRNFNFLAGCFVLLNGILVGVSTEYEAIHRGEPHRALWVLEWIFCAFFTAELLLRLFVFGRGYFTMPDWRFNVLDFAVVSTQLFEALLIAMGVLSDQRHINVTFMRLVRILRLMRIVRAARVLRLVSELRTLVACIGASLKSLAWTVVLLAFMLYTLGVWLTQLASDFEGEGEHAVLLDKYYGSLGSSMLSLFQAITGGIDWSEALAPLLSCVSMLMGPLFVLYIAFAVLALMNSLTGVFVEAALRSAKQDNDFFIMSNLLELFLDSVGNFDGTLTLAKFEEQLDNPQMLEYFRAIDVDLGEARNVFRLLDLDGSGTLNAESFLSGCLRLRGPAKSLDVMLLMREVRDIASDLQTHAGRTERLLAEVTKDLSRRIGSLRQAALA